MVAGDEFLRQALGDVGIGPGVVAPDQLDLTPGGRSFSWRLT